MRAFSYGFFFLPLFVWCIMSMQTWYELCEHSIIMMTEYISFDRKLWKTRWNKRNHNFLIKLNAGWMGINANGFEKFVHCIGIGNILCMVWTLMEPFFLHWHFARLFNVFDLKPVIRDISFFSDDFPFSSFIAIGS